MSGVNGGNQDVDIDLGRVISAVWERKFRVIGATVLMAAVAFAAASLMKPSYKSETRLLIESRSPDIAGGGAAAQANDPILDSLNITSQAQLLQSTDLIRRVARDLKLAQIKEFDPAAQSSFPDPLVLVGLRQDPMKLDPEDRVIQEFRGKLNVYPVENSRVIAIEFSSRDPKLAAEIPNKMAAVYLEIQSGAKLDTHSETAKWLEPEIASLTQKVQEAERKVADYRSSNGLFQATDANSFSTKQLNDISTELTRVRADRANAEARAENVRTALKAGRDASTLTDVVSSQVIQRLKEAEANLQAQINDRSTQLLDNHPTLKGLRAQLVGIRQQIDSETKKILASLDNDATLGRLREQQLMGQLNGLKADSARAGEEEVGLRALDREATAQRQLLETYLARYREATSRLGSNSSPADARVVSRAVEPSEPYFPKVIPIVVVITLATFILSCLLIIVIELFSGRALRPVVLEDDDFDGEPSQQPTTVIIPPVAAVVATRVAAPTPGARRVQIVAPQAEQVEAPELPVHRMQAEVASFDRPVAAGRGAGIIDNRPPASRGTLVEPVRPALAQPVEILEVEDDTFSIGTVANYLQRHGIAVAIAVSPTGDEGSTATVMLAREMAERGRTVVLVDMTGSACPTKLMTASAGLPGITDLLCGAAAFGEAIHPDRLSTAHVVPHGASDAAQAMRGVDRLTMIVDALSDAYDLVLVECGPAETASLSRLTRSADADIVLSVPGLDDAEVAELVTDFEAAGYRNLLVMAGQADRHSPRPGRRQAA